MTDVEKLSGRRRWLLAIMAVTFTVWTAADLEVSEAFAANGNRWLTLIGTVAGLLWGAALLVFITSFARSKIDPGARAVLEDELVTANRKTACTFAYVAMLLSSAVMLVATKFNLVIGKDAVNIILIVGVAVPMTAFAWLEGRGG